MNIIKTRGYYSVGYSKGSCNASTLEMAMLRPLKVLLMMRSTVMFTNDVIIYCISDSIMKLAYTCTLLVALLGWSHIDACQLLIGYTFIGYIKWNRYYN